MITDDLKQRLKSIPIPAYLDRMGLQPVLINDKRFKYISPLREETTASFWIHLETNTYKDFGDEKGGDIIQLVQRIHGFSFIDACKHLANHLQDGQTPLAFPIGQKALTADKESKLVVTDTKPITSKGLWKYIHRRCINPTVAKKYLVEIHYKRGNKRSFALGFENDKKGYALRNPYWKSSIGENYITTLHVANSTTINLFEGFMNFLSSCSYFGTVEPRNTTVVLNSTSNLHHVLESLKSYKQANVYFDNDEAGKRAKEKVAGTGIKIFDGAAKYYPNHNDFNDMLTGKEPIKKP